MIVHASAFSAFLIPVGNLLSPLVVWLLKCEGPLFVDSHGKPVLNFQISMLIYFIVSVILVFVFIGIGFFQADWNGNIRRGLYNNRNDKGQRR